jgi:hypothetical protein
MRFDHPRVQALASALAASSHPSARSSEPVHAAPESDASVWSRCWPPLRRRRHELEYPHLPSDAATSEEAGQAAETAQRLIAAAGKLLPQLSFFSQDQELRDHHRKPRHGIVPARSQPSPTRPPP